MVWAIAALNAVAFLVLSHHLTAAHEHLVEHIERRTNTLRGAIVSEVQSAVDAITSTLVKAQREIVSRIADVQAQLDAAGFAEQIDLSSLTAAAQALDDVVPDDGPAAA